MMGQSNATGCTVQSERTASNGRLPKEGIMKITAVECAVLMAPDFDPDHCDTAQDNVVVQVHTDDTVRGIGEVESNPWAIKALIEYGGSNSLSRGLAELLVGQDPSDPRAA
jgi:L-alanine-DL-glutamate epimerase-like enolase superfamily enzyme